MIEWILAIVLGLVCVIPFVIMLVVSLKRDIGE